MLGSRIGQAAGVPFHRKSENPQETLMPKSSEQLGGRCASTRNDEPDT
jgi:hypothetical protein